MSKRPLAILLLSLFVSSLPAQASDMHIPTDMEGHWALPALIRASRWTGGYPDHTWRPDTPITRAEFFTLLSRAMQARPALGGVPFAERTHWSIVQGWIPAALQAGLIEPSDYVENQFEPDRPITRQEVIVAAIRAAGYEGHALANDTSKLDPQTVTDLEVLPSWLHPWVSLALDHGLVKGYPDGSIRAASAMTRAEALTVVVRIIDLLSLPLSDTHASPAPNGRQYAGGEPVWFQSGWEASRPKIQAGSTTYLLPEGSGDVQLFPTTGAKAWLSYTLDGASVLALLADGSLREVRRQPLQNTNALTGLAADASGALYVNEGAALVRLKPDGTQTLVANDLPLSHPVIDPVGNLWGIDKIGTKLVRVTSTGTITQSILPVAPPAQVISTIIPAPDGRLWLLRRDQTNVRTDAIEIQNGHVEKTLLLLPTRLYGEGAIPPVPASVSEGVAWFNRTNGPSGSYRFDLATGDFQTTLAPQGFEGPLQAVPSAQGGTLLVDAYGNFWTVAKH